MTGLWDYDDEDGPACTTAPGPACTASPGPIELINSGDDGDPPHKKRRGRKPVERHKKPVAKTKFTRADLELSDDQAEGTQDDDELLSMCSLPPQSDVATNIGISRTKTSALGSPKSAAAPAPAQISSATKLCVADALAFSKDVRSMNDPVDDPSSASPSLTKPQPKAALRRALPSTLPLSFASGPPVALEVDTAQQAANTPGIPVPVPAPAGEPKIVITCQYLGGGSIKIGIRPSDTFGKLLSSFQTAATQRGVVLPPGGIADMRVLLDGDRMELDDTLASQDLEDGQSVDVAWKR